MAASYAPARQAAGGGADEKRREVRTMELALVQVEVT
jgi:hypothetical protein